MSCEEVRRIISSLPLNKSPGPDKIHTRVYRDCLPVILGPLTEIINSSLESAKYPDAWKFAEVIPLLKACNLLATKKSVFMVLSWIYEPWVKLTEVKIPGSGKHRVFHFFQRIIPRIVRQLLA